MMRALLRGATTLEIAIEHGGMTVRRRCDARVRVRVCMG